MRAMVPSMASAAHETLVAMFTEQPTLLHVLLAKLGHDGAALPPVTDSAVRFIEPAEVRPDAFFEAPDVPWIGVEVQGTEDDAKRRRWPLLVAIKLDQSTIMGDLVVITHSRALGKWARTCVVHRGPRGTVLTTPSSPCPAISFILCIFATSRGVLSPSSAIG